MKTRQTLWTVILMTLFPLFIFAQTVDVNEGCNPLTVEFTPPAGATDFFWDFKDAVTSALPDPSHTFSSEGVYEVEFREGVGGPLLGTVQITVYPSPVILIAGDPRSGCEPLGVSFQNESILDPAIMITSYEWVFGDGNSAAGPTPTNTFNTGSFDVSLAIETNIPNCNRTEIFENFINVSSAPATSFITDPNPPLSCTAPLTVNFTNTTSGAGLTFLWDFGNGVTSADANPAPQTYTTDGLYTVSLTATDANDCARTVTRNVSVGSPQANFLIPDTVCINTEVGIMNNSAPGAYTWDFGVTSDPPTSSFSNPTVVFTQQGFQEVSLTVNAVGGCSGDTTIMVYVDQADATFSIDPTFSCSEPLTIDYTPTVMDDSNVYEWTFYDGNNSAEVSPTYSRNNDDVTIYSMNGRLVDSTQLIIETPAGCRDTFTVVDTLHQPNALFLPDVTKGCAPLTVEFADSSSAASTIINWEYDYGDGNTAAFMNDDPHTYTFDTPGEYEVVLNIATEGGCVDTSYAVMIEVGDAITPDFSADNTTVCPGDTVHFVDLTNNSDIDGWHFGSENGRTSHCFQENELFYVFDNVTGPQDVSLTVDYNGCFSEITKLNLVTVSGPIAVLDYETNCDNPSEVMFRDSSLDATMITWDFGDMNTSNLADVTHTYSDTGMYKVYLTAENPGSGCPASVDSAIVYVKEIVAGINLMDTIYCLGTEIMLDGTNSQDVDNRCWKGYDWHFDFPYPVNRPITTQDSIVSKTLEAPGDFTITLVTTDINGCRDTAMQDICVKEIVADFSISDDFICTPSEVMFEDLSTADTTIVSWEWDFGDGMGMSTQQDPNYEFTIGGVTEFTVALSIEDAVGCPAEISKQIQVYEPISTITTGPSPANICVGSDVTFNATDFTIGGSNLTWEWDFANGETSMNQSDVATYNTSGSFEVNLHITEIATGCENDIPFTVEVQDFPIADIASNVDGQTPLCYPENIMFTDNSVTTSPLTQTWDFGNGQTATGPNPSANFGKGTFEVEMIVSTSFGCMDMIQETFTLVGPEGDFVMDKNMICRGEEITFSLVDTTEITSFSWDFGDGIIVDDQNPISHVYDFNPPGGQTVATLTLRGIGDVCTFPVTQPVFIRQTTANFIGGDACSEPVDFMNTSTDAQIFNWNFDDGATSTEESPLHEFPGPGVYDVSLVVEESTLGCQDSITIPVEVFALPDVSADDGATCEGTTLQLSVNNPVGSSTYIWTPSSAVTNVETNGSVVSVDVTNSTTLQVSTRDSNGCQDSTNVQVNIVGRLPVILGDTMVVCPNEPFILDIPETAGVTYEWSPTEGVSDPNVANPMFVVTGNESGNQSVYTLTRTDETGTCPRESTTFIIRTPDLDDGLPNAFTPDGDGVNDYFNLVFQNANDADDFEVDEFKVYNRFGNLVYNNDNPQRGWNGFHKGKLAPSDVYMYKIVLSLEGCPQNPQTGEVTLIR